jgi:hypothetical protein
MAFAIARVLGLSLPELVDMDLEVPGGEEFE